MSRQKNFRVGRVTAYARGSMWYLRYHENGRRRQVRASADKDASRQLAAQVNAQLEVGAPAMTSFESVGLSDLRKRWLDHHEHVLRSALSTINRYRTASDHLLRFVRDVQPVKYASQFREAHAEGFVRYLRELRTSPNGHRNAIKRRLRDKGLKFVLYACRTMFNFAVKRRHLPPYADNPFKALEIGRIPVDDAKPITLFSPEQEKKFLEACDDWQLPIFATLMLTGVRPGELTHLLLPDDADFDQGWLRIRNKPELGWQVKTRNERRLPLLPEVVDSLKILAAGRNGGLVFQRRRRRKFDDDCRRLSLLSPQDLAGELAQRVEESKNAAENSRQRHRAESRRLWSQIGHIPEARLRTEFMKLTAAIGMPHVTAPKTLRHLFATALMEGNVDPMIRSQLMGHVASGDARSKGPLGMTGVYTHASPATIRRQMEAALGNRPAVAALRRWLESKR
jgi:integrase